MGVKKSLKRAVCVVEGGVIWQLQEGMTMKERKSESRKHFFLCAFAFKWLGK
jgi:hypothetical protein